MNPNDVHVRFIYEVIDRATRAALAVDRTVRDSSNRTTTESQRNLGVLQRAHSAYARTVQDSTRRVVSGMRQQQTQHGALTRAALKTASAYSSMSTHGRALTRDLASMNIRFQAFRNLLNSLKWPAIIASVGFLAQAFSALSGGAIAVTAALAPLAGALVAIPAAIGGAVQAIGTLTLAFGGLKDTLTAYDHLQLGAARNAESTANKHKAAAEAIRNAQERLRSTQERAKDAQEALTRAISNARQEMVDVALAAEQAGNAQARAAIALRRAQAEAERTNLDPTSSQFDREDAALAVDEARTALKQARVDKQRAVREQQAADRAGVMGSDQVKKALEDQRDAARQVKEARHDLGVAKDKGDSVQAPAAQDRYKALYDRLSKEGKQFVDFYNKTLYPIINDKLPAAAGKELFPKLITGIKATFTNLPVLEHALTKTGGVIGDLAVKIGKFAGGKEFGHDLKVVTDNNAKSMATLGNSGIGLGKAFLRVYMAAQPLITWMVKVTASLMDQSAAWLNAKTKSGDTAKFFDSTRRVMTTLGHTIRDVTIGIINIFSGGTKLGNDLLGSTEKNAAVFRKWTESTKGKNAIADYFEAIREPIYSISKLILEVVKGFARIGKSEGLSPLIDALRTELLPTIENTIKQTTSTFGPALVGLLAALLQLFSAMHGPLTVLLDSFAVISKVIAFIVEHVPGVKLFLGTFIALSAAMKGLNILKSITGIGLVESKVRQLAGKWMEVVRAEQLAIEKGAAASAAAAKTPPLRAAQAAYMAPTAAAKGSALDTSLRTQAARKAGVEQSQRRAAQSQTVAAIPTPVPRSRQSRTQRAKRIAGRSAMAGGGIYAGLAIADAATARADGTQSTANKAINTGLNVAMLGSAAAAIAPLAAAMGKLGPVAKAGELALKGLTLAAGPLVAALATVSLPVLAIIAAVVAAGVAIYIFRDKIAAGLTAVVGFFKKHSHTIVQIVAALTAPLWVPVMLAIAAANVAIKAGLDAFSAVFRVALGVIRALWGTFGDIFLAPIRAALSVGKAVLHGYIDVLKFELKALIAVVSTVWGGFTSLFSAPVKKGIDIVKGLFEGDGVAKKFLDAGKGLGKSVLKGMESIFDSAADFGKGILKSIFKAIDNALPNKFGPVGLPHNPLKDLGLYAGGGYIVPGDPRRDGTLILAAGDEAVITGPGQAMLNAVAPGLLDAVINTQPPHFAKGGYVTKPSFADSLLTKMSLPDNAVNRKAIVGWENAEGGHWNNTASYNPLNTTWNKPGSKSINSHGVKAFTSWEQGLQATVDTLRSYHGILATLRKANDAMSTAAAIGSSPWGTNAGLVKGAIAAASGARDGGSLIGSQATKHGSTKTSPARKVDKQPELAKAKKTPARFLAPWARAAIVAPSDEGAFSNAFQAAQSSGFNLYNYLGGITSDVYAATIQSGAALTDPDAVTGSSSAVKTTSKKKRKATSKKKPTRNGGMPSGHSTPNTSWNPARKPIANWIIPYLSWASKNGWGGTVSSGLRTFAEQTYLWNNAAALGLVRGKTVAKPGTSNHEGDTYPRGAVDVRDYTGLNRVLGRYPGPKNLKWAGMADPPHFSHPHGGAFRRGGRVSGLRRFATGGWVNAFKKGGKVKATKMPGAVYSSGGNGRNSSGRTKIADMGLGIGGSAEEFEDGLGWVQGIASQASVQVLQSMQAGIKKNLADLSTRKQTPAVTQAIARLQAELTIVDAAAGAYVGKIVKQANDIIASIDKQKAALSRTFQQYNIDEASSQGQAALASFYQQQVTQLQAAAAKINEAIAVAASFGQSDIVDQLTQQLSDINEQIAQAAVDGAVAANQAVLAVAKEQVDKAAAGSQMQSTLEKRLELQQQLQAGPGGKSVYDTAGGRIDRANFINTNVVTSLQGELGALQNEQATALSVNPATGQARDQKLADQLAQAIADKQNDILSAQLEAQQLIEQNTKEAADALKELTGSLAFEYRGQQFSDDFASVGTGL